MLIAAYILGGSTALFLLWIGWEYGRAMMKERAFYTRNFKTARQWERDFFNGH